MSLVSDFKGSQLKKWNSADNGQLRLASSSLININIQGEANPLVRYRRAELSLKNFNKYKYSEGIAAPKNCLDWS
ncbi:hypothetical protein DSM106972_096560 [Dulcicalothrix desertica PCC 7102]|uniref:Uncharacterized protein n=1 Tax=Dulcicalothrix desertica PCC 7102 TaxID=232991 RepID=A0A433UHJ8_9CYAN|nr:hypothetical protein [Dulcicalothrix desertica]RUS93300.1 hypothetical protein DSM106972_096560 [Dulcicalothrix desertica PCC 7102]